MNTNGAGDGALAALLHDITANSYHRSNVPNSSKHKFTPLTYSSLAQVCKYANRVSYQVLNQHSPRLTRGLPEREDSPGRVLLGSLSYRRFVGQIRRSRRIWHLASRCPMRRWRVLSCLHIFSYFTSGNHRLPRHHFTRRWRFQQFQHSTGNFTFTHHYLIRATFGDIRHFIVIMGAGR